MNKEILHKILYPHFIVFILFVSIISGLLTYTLMYLDTKNLLSYLVYVLSAYALVLVCMRMYVLIIKLNKRKEELYQKHSLLYRYKTDVHFKIHVSLYASFTLNMIYTLLRLLTGIYYQSFWFITLAAYYFLLAIMRFLLLSHMPKNSLGTHQITEAKKYRLCGFVIGFMTLALGGEVFMVVKNNQGFAYGGYLIYVVALYDFYNIISAFVNILKYKKMNNFVMSAAKIISFISALVSMLSLETAMLTQFGQNNTPQFRQLMTGLTGMLVCFIVLCISIYMIVHANKKIKDL